MTLAAVVVHYDSPEYTLGLLSSLGKCSGIATIVLVDHSEIESLAPQSGIVLLKQENRGYGAGINYAVRYLLENQPQVQNVLAMNPDIELDGSAIKKLVQVHEYEKAALTFPSIQEPGVLLRGYCVGRYGTIHRREEGAHLFPGTCFLFSVQAWKEAGGFNEGYFHYFEDFDFCETIHRRSGKIAHCPEVVVKHVGKSGRIYPRTALPKYAVRNHLLFHRKFGRLDWLSFSNICLRQLFYLLRWPSGMRGIPQWYAGIREFRIMKWDE